MPCIFLSGKWCLFEKTVIYEVYSVPERYSHLQRAWRQAVEEEVIVRDGLPHLWAQIRVRPRNGGERLVHIHAPEGGPHGPQRRRFPGHHLAG